MSLKKGRKLFFNPVSGELRFDIKYDIPDDIPASISWPMDKQRHDLSYGFKNLTLALTTNCNLSCDYCWQKHGGIPDMKQETIDYWLDFFLDKEKNLPRKILYYGGEPLLRMDLIQYSSQKAKQICREREIEIPKQHIFTNATLLNNYNLDILERENIYLILSIDGAPSINAVHRHASNNEDFSNQIAAGIRRLHERNMKFGVCCTLSDVNFDIDSTLKFILSEIRPSSIELNLRHDKEFCKCAERYENKLLDSFLKAWDLIRSYGVMNIDLSKRLYAISKREPLQNSSSGSKNKLSVMPNGTISTFNGAISYPSLQIQPVGMWIDNFKSRWNRNVLNQEKCKKCSAAFICGQGSAFSSFLQYGDFEHTPALHCEYCKTMLVYFIDTIEKNLPLLKELPYGYTLSFDDIKSVFPDLFYRYQD